MYERDYILRMIEAFAKMLAAIVGFREKGELDKARALVEETYESMLKVESSEIKEYDHEQWNQFCSKRSPEELEMLADLFKVEGEILLDAGKPEQATWLLAKALELLKLVEAQSGAFSLTRSDKINELEKTLSKWET
jgi:phosphoglycolate phosphatase-like HAD superfamily hydrolase